MLVILVLFSLYSSAQARRSHELSTGLAKLHFNQAPPDFTFPDGKRYDKLSGLVGKPVVINFWATWCHACTDEFPAFAQMQATYGDRVAFITLSNEAEGVARAYLAGHHVALPLLEDPHGVVFGAYSVALFPVTVVVSASGTVSYVSVGGLDWPELQGAIERAFQPGASH
ncbi:MAG: TlpA family protein disulfide reductase [Candidatus Eremiobacteraeota bacterium]|nr:TlpA family protein disulfide reductase [Candidatus Eremiobacteraeota bacterium]